MEGLRTAQVLIDLSAAFDVVDHSVLLKRLQSFIGIGGTASKWCVLEILYSVSDLFLKDRSLDRIGFL